MSGDGTFRVRYPNNECGNCCESIHIGHRARFTERDGERVMTHALCPGEREGTYRSAPADVRALNAERVRQARRALGD